MATLLGPYEIRGKLGAGAMAVVWRGWDPKLEREVAIKEPMRSPTMSAAMMEELSERFVGEGKAAARLSHPGIVTIFAAGVFDGRAAIVMELLRGQTLSSVIDGRALSPAATASIIDQLLDALDYAHTMGVVHRDIKPDNVFVTDDGRVKLTDFGIAHVKRLDGGSDGIIAGTPGYMAPEQIRAEAVDGRADLFGLGAIAYEMLVGRNPFGATDGADTHSIMYRTTNGPAVEFDPADGIPSEVGGIVLRALERDRDARWSSAGEMRAAFHAAAPALLWGGAAPVAGAVDAGDHPFSSSSVHTTLDALRGGVPKRSSVSWSLGAAAVVAVVLLGVLALLLGPNTGDIGLLVLIASGVGGIVWWMARKKAKPSQDAAREPDLFGMLVDNEAAGEETVQLRLRSPTGERLLRVALPCVIGRSSDAQLDVEDDLVSRRHAMLERRGDCIWVSDLGSRNGTFVDGAPVGTGAPFQPGSAVTVGSTEIRQAD